MPCGFNAEQGWEDQLMGGAPSTPSAVSPSSRSGGNDFDELANQLARERALQATLEAARPAPVSATVTNALDELGGLDQMMARASGAGLLGGAPSGGDVNLGDDMPWLAPGPKAIPADPSGRFIGRTDEFDRTVRPGTSMYSNEATISDVFKDYFDIGPQAYDEVPGAGFLKSALPFAGSLYTGVNALGSLATGRLPRGIQTIMDLFGGKWGPPQNAGRTFTDFGFPSGGEGDLTQAPFDFQRFFNAPSTVAPAIEEAAPEGEPTLTGLQSGFFDEINAAFPGDAFQTLDADIINSIVSERQGAASGQVANSFARGNLNEAGSFAANEALGTQAEGATTRLGEIGASVLGGNRQGITDIRDRAFNTASDFRLGDDLFDIAPFTGERQGFIDERQGSFRDDVLSSLGSERLFNPFDAISAGGRDQGVVSGIPVNQSFLDVIAAREGGANDQRGLGTKGSGTF